MKQITGTVEVKVKDAQTGEEKMEKANVSYPYFESAEDVLTELAKTGEPVEFQLSDEKKTKVQIARPLAEILESLNYGANLKARAAVRANLLAKLEGPGNAINKLVAQIQKARAASGKPISEASARKIALLMMESEQDAEAEAATTEVVSQ